jgi:hypothetical protein
MSFLKTETSISEHPVSHVPEEISCLIHFTEHAFRSLEILSKCYMNNLKMMYPLSSSIEINQMQLLKSLKTGKEAIENIMECMNTNLSLLYDLQLSAIKKHKELYSNTNNDCVEESINSVNIPLENIEDNEYLEQNYKDEYSENDTEEDDSGDYNIDNYNKDENEEEYEEEEQEIKEELQSNDENENLKQQYKINVEATTGTSDKPVICLWTNILNEDKPAIPFDNIHDIKEVTEKSNLLD